MTNDKKCRANGHEWSGQQWYDSLLAGASTFSGYLFDGSVYDSVSRVLSRLSPDEYSDFVKSFLHEGLSRHGGRWRYADICTVLKVLAETLEVLDYMEIGVRRGRSLAMVASARPGVHIVGFDLWQENYAGMDNPGPDFVRAELAKAGYQGEPEFVSGDSHETVPAYFAANPDAYFDLITVDGDHTEMGARLDLLTVIPRLRIGGALVFDDIIHPQHEYLMDVWNKTIKQRKEFSTYEFTELGYGVAFAIRHA